MHIVILGNGISGVTTARYIRKNSNHRITIVSNESDHFYSRTALMYIYMGHMLYEDTKPYEDWFWEKNGIELVRGFVQSIDFGKKKLNLEGEKEILFDKLVLAVGAKPNKFGWKGQDLTGVQGLYGLGDLQEMERNTRGIKKAVVVGGGLIGIEMAEMLHSRHISTTLLVREKSYMDAILPPEESEMVSRHIRANGIDLRLETELDEIHPDASGRVSAIYTRSGEKIACQFVGLTVGVSPNVDFLRDTALQVKRGIVVNEHFETNIPDVFAIGDCAEFEKPQPNQRPIEQLWYTGKMHGEVLGQRLSGLNVSYQKGVFFNSAKFFDIEYQVYGQISTQLSAHEDTLYWEHPNGRKSIRIQFHKTEKHVLGFNLMGIRYRHAQCVEWIRQKASIETVLKNLRKANFDPEFFVRYEPELVRQYEGMKE
jgi:NAD(P)H-nitrite reductase large subunit